MGAFMERGFQRVVGDRVDSNSSLVGNCIALTVSVGVVERLDCDA